MQHKDFARALRRHHRARLKKARQFYWGRGTRAEFNFGWTPQSLGMVVDTPTPCSCFACGNWRKTEGRTVQERRVYQEPIWVAVAELGATAETCEACGTTQAED